MFIQLLLTGSEKRKTDYSSTLVKCQHNAAPVATRRTSNASVNRRLALGESAENKQTFGFTNRAASSLLTLAQPQKSIQVSRPVAFLHMEHNQTSAHTAERFPEHFSISG